VYLSFTDSSGQPAPANQAYTATVTGPSTFTINATGLATGTYTENTNVVTVTMSGHGLATSNWVYLVFTSGSASNGVYQVASVADSSHFTVAAADTNITSGNCLIPKLTGGGYSQSRTNVTVSTSLPHGLNPGDEVFINFTAAGSPADGRYPILAVPDATHFTIVVTNSVNTTQNGQVIFPLAAPPLVRSGTAMVGWGTWGMNTTDTGSSANLMQTPLNSPTVFNFFFPDYKFQGPLAAAGITTPEFQLTSDTGVALQMNFLEGGLLNNTGNTNGLSSFTGGNGAIVLDLGPWMTVSFTSNGGIASLVDALSSLLTGGQLTPAARNAIVSYVANSTNFPYGSPPSNSQMRDRVRAVAHLILTSPDFTVQR
jgi:hypothetical protein